jgi:hypothetical protein
MEELIRAAGRRPVQRSTLYGAAPPAQVARSLEEHAVELAPLVVLAPAAAAGRI